MALNGQQVVLVTGATDGIGRETALELSRRGARVLVHGRSRERALAVLAELTATTGTEPLEPLVCDFASLAEVKNAAALLSDRGLAVSVLVNNAGVYMREFRTSVDGHEMTFAVNHLAPFALTHALLQSAAGANLTRVVNVSSIAHSRATLDLTDLSFVRRGYDAYAAYGASKLANVLFTVELARLLRSRGVMVNALHPGVVSTKLLTVGFGSRGSDSLSQGAATSVRLAVSSDTANVTGEYWSGGKRSGMNPLSADHAFVRRFYEESARLAGVNALLA